MKKILFISFVCSLSTNLLSQSPQTGTSMSAAEANRLNGTVQPTMKDGKPYSQWVAEEKAKQQAASVQSQNIAKNTNGKNDGVQSEKAVQPQRNLNVQGSSVEPAATPEAAVVKTETPKPAAKVAGPSPFSGGTVASKPAPVAEKSIAGSSQDPNAVAVVPAASKPAGRTPAEIEKAKQLEESQDKVKAPVKEVAAVSSEAKAPVPPPAVEPARPAATTNNQ